MNKDLSKELYDIIQGIVCRYTKGDITVYDCEVMAITREILDDWKAEWTRDCVKNFKNENKDFQGEPTIYNLAVYVHKCRFGI